MKVEVLQDCVLRIKKGTIIEVDERQFEIARRVLKPVEKVAQEEAPKEKRTKKK